MFINFNAVKCLMSVLDRFWFWNGFFLDRELNWKYRKAFIVHLLHKAFPNILDTVIFLIFNFSMNHWKMDKCLKTNANWWLILQNRPYFIWSASSLKWLFSTAHSKLHRFDLWSSKLTLSNGQPILFKMIWLFVVCWKL